MASRDATLRAEGELLRLCHSGLDVAELQVGVLRSLRRLMPVDAAFFATADPGTLLFTGALSEEPLQAAAARIPGQRVRRGGRQHVRLAGHVRVAGRVARRRDPPRAPVQPALSGDPAAARAGRRAARRTEHRCRLLGLSVSASHRLRARVHRRRGGARRTPGSPRRARTAPGRAGLRVAVRRRGRGTRGPRAHPRVGRRRDHAGGRGPALPDAGTDARCPAADRRPHRGPRPAGDTAAGASHGGRPRPACLSPRAAGSPCTRRGSAGLRTTTGSP